MNMKQFSALFILLVSFFVPVSAFAAGQATLQFSEQNVSMEVGQMTDLFILVEPKGEQLDTIRSIFTFDPALVSVQAVSRVGAFDRNTPGNSIDNQNGMVSWGAFTLQGPINSAGQVFKVTLLAKQAGQTELKFTSDSKLISNGEEKINLSSRRSLSVTITEAAPVDPGISLLTLASSSHPQESNWYSKKTVELSWTVVKGESEIVAYYFAFDEHSDSDPALYLAPDQTTRTVQDVKDGIHFFHLKGVQADGKITKTVHRSVLVDTEKPNPIAITVSTEQLLEGESLWMTFATTDEFSGVEQYKVSINTSEFLPQSSPLEITDLVAGTYFIRVAAVDRAGNVATQGQSVRVYPKGTELVRPEGFNPNNEIDTLTSATNGISTTKLFPTKLLITFALVVAGGFGIIYLIRKKKK